MTNLNRTVEELKTAIKEEMTLNPGLITPTEIMQYINDAVTDIANGCVLEKDVEMSVVDGVASLPSDFVDINLVYCGTRRLMLGTIGRSGSSNGTPIEYVINGDNLVVYPKPASAIVRLYYTYRPNKLTIGTEKPDIPNGYDDLIVTYAVARAFRKNGDIGLYREYMTTYEEKKYTLQQEMVKRQNNRVVTPMQNDEREGVHPYFLGY